MPKKTKFKLQDLRVKSFVTSLDDDEKNGVKGGFTTVIIRVITTTFTDLLHCEAETPFNPPATEVACPTQPGLQKCISAYSPIQC
jgi:hypothetical protein